MSISRIRSIVPTFVRATVCSVITATLLSSGGAWAERASVAENPTIDGSLTVYEPVNKLEGKLTITGSDTMAMLTDQLAFEFTRIYGYPSVNIFVEHPGSNFAMREFLVGFSKQRRGDKSRSEGHEAAAYADILASSRVMTPEERGHFKSRYGHDVLEIPIALDGVGIYVHAANPIPQLTLQQVDAIFSSSRKLGWPSDITSWDKAGVEEWSSRDIHLYGRDSKSGTREFFVQTALGGGTLRSDLHEQPGSAMEILSIARDPQAIGYAGIGYQGSFVKVVPIAAQANGQAVLPTAETVTDHRYPLSRKLYLYVNHEPGKKFENPVLREFLLFVNSRQGQEIVSKAQFYPVTKEQLAQNLVLIQDKATTAGLESNHRSGKVLPE